MYNKIKFLVENLTFISVTYNSISLSSMELVREADLLYQCFTLTQHLEVQA